MLPGIKQFPLALLVLLSMERHLLAHECMCHPSFPLEQHNLSRTFTGSTDKPSFAKRIDEQCNPTNPDKSNHEVKNAVILLNEMEKAHYSIRQSFLQVFESYEYIASYVQGAQNVEERYKFVDCLFIMTSNLFGIEIKDAFNKKQHSEEQISQLFRDLNINNPHEEKNFSSDFLSRMTIIPFGPISKGEKSFQLVVSNEFNTYIDKWKKDFKFKEFSVESRNKILSIIEEEIYRDGTDLRAVKEYFDELTEVIIENQGDWAEDLEKVKLTFHVYEEDFCLQASVFLEAYEDYGNVGELIRL